jgi:Rrf2 family protein
MLSKKTQYALKAVSYLSSRYNTTPVQIVEISERKGIPLKFLENILLELKKAGILESKKGKGGGYYFAIPPENIPIAKIIRTIDGPISLFPCVSIYFYQKCDDCDEISCKINKVFAEARDAILKVLEGKTAKDIEEDHFIKI